MCCIFYLVACQKQFILLIRETQKFVGVHGFGG